MSMPASWYNTDRVAYKGSVVLDRFMAERAALKNVGPGIPTSSGTKGSELYEWLTGAGNLSSAGPAVTERTAMSISAVYACVGLIGGALSSLPLTIYRRAEGANERADHEVWWLFNEQPCAAMSAAVMWEFLAWSLLLHGDAIAIIRRFAPMNPRIIAIEPVHPLDVTVVRHEGRLIYTIIVDGVAQVFDQDDILHIPGLGFNGTRGLSPLRHAARQSMGTALAADEYSARFFSNGARPDYVVSVPGKMDPTAANLFRESWMARYAGVGNSHVPAILSGGGDVKALGLSPEDAQLIQTRQYNASDIARFYGVPPHMVGIVDKTSSWGTGIEQQSIGFVKYTLSRHLVKFEQEINRKVFRRSPVFFAEFVTAGLERGDYKTRNEGYRIALGRAGEPGWMTVNEVRRLDNLPPLADGDKLNIAASPASTSSPAEPADPAAPQDPEKEPT